MQFVKRREVLSRVCMYTSDAQPSSAGSVRRGAARASVSIPESGSLSPETGRELLECILSPRGLLLNSKFMALIETNFAQS